MVFDVSFCCWAAFSSQSYQFKANPGLSFLSHVIPSLESWTTSLMCLFLNAFSISFVWIVGFEMCWLLNYSTSLLSLKRFNKSNLNDCARSFSYFPLTVSRQFNMISASLSLSAKSLAIDFIKTVSFPVFIDITLKIHIQD